VKWSTDYDECTDEHRIGHFQIQATDNNDNNNLTTHKNVTIDIRQLPQEESVTTDITEMEPTTTA